MGRPIFHPAPPRPIELVALSIIYGIIDCAGGVDFEFESSSAKKLGATWLRRGLQSRVVHTEDQSPRKSIWKSTNANDERFALAA
jgi:hypothetical protein